MLILLFWTTGSWWIPLLIILGIWRHGVKRFPLTYTPRYRGIVFPLGMYTVATFKLGLATGITFLEVISRYSIYVAMAAWAITCAGMLHHFFGEIIFGRMPMRPSEGLPEQTEERSRLTDMRARRVS